MEFGSEVTNVNIEEENQEVELEQEHPLQNSLITNLILSHLPLSSLLVCRQVSRNFDDESRPYLSRMGKATITSDSSLRSFISIFLSNRNFFDTVQIGPYMYMGSDLTDRFFQLYGIYLRHLVLHKTQCSAPQLREILFRWCPNLEEFTLVGSIPGNGKGKFLEDMDHYEKLSLGNLRVLNLNLFIPNRSEDLCRDFLSDLLSLTPNLERITIPNTTYKGFLPNLMAVLLQSPELPLMNLKSIGTLFTLDGDGQIEQLRDRKYPLEELNLQLMPNITLDVLLSLLDSLTSTLKKLRIHFYLTSFKELPPIVRLDKLEELMLDNYAGSLQFVAYLPELKKLSVQMKNMREMEEALPRTHTGPSFWSNNTLESFETRLTSVNEGNPARVIERSFENVFPGLSSISFPGLSDMALKLICGSYPKLKELHAMQGVYSDMGITGIAEGKLRYLARCNDLDMEHCTGILFSSTEMGLVALKGLEKLSLQSPYVTDDSIFFAILHMRSLKELSIERCDITDKGIDAITKQMDLQSLSINLCTRVSGPQVELLTRRMKNRNLVVKFD